MKLIKRIIELAFILFVISVFMKNKDVVLTLNYFGFPEPLTVAFWELVIFCVSLGIIIAAVGDLITELEWLRERRKMSRDTQERTRDLKRLSDRVDGLEAENEKLMRDLEAKSTPIHADTVPAGGPDVEPSEPSDPEVEAAGRMTEDPGDGSKESAGPDLTPEEDSDRVDLSKEEDPGEPKQMDESESSDPKPEKSKM